MYVEPDWCWTWNSNTLATWWGKLTHLKKPWCWGRLRAGGEGDDRGWDGWMASPTQWTWVWVDSRSCWWTGKPGVLQLVGSQRVRHDWATELNWTERRVWKWLRRGFHLQSIHRLFGEIDANINATHSMRTWPVFMGFPGSSAGKESACNAGRLWFHS